MEVAMKVNDFPLLAAILGAVILVSPAGAAVRHHGSAGMSAHRAGPSVHAFHRTVAISSHRRLAHRGTVHAGHGFAGRYAYARRLGHGHGGAGNYGAAAVAGTYAGDGYAYSDYGGGAYGTGYVHRGCRWYRYHEPYNLPYRCRAYGYAYGGPLYAVSYGYGHPYGHWHGHHHRFAWSGGLHSGRRPAAFAGANHVHIDQAAHIAGERHFAAPHGAGGGRLARIGRPKLH
jgi:hypothetical protein